MATERTIYCDGPDCGDRHQEGAPCHARTIHPPPHLPAGFIETRQGGDVADHVLHFCSWDCVLKYAAKLPPTEVIPWGPPPSEHDDVQGDGDA